jgi:glycosyltransferase involved in cell wall biosynthesis
VNLATADLLLVLPVPFRRTGELLLELQASYGIEWWLENFKSLIVAAPVIPETLADAQRNVVWTAAEPLRGRVQFVPLPWARSARAFVRYFCQTRRLLSQCIDVSCHRQFAIGALFGDWGGVAAEIAISRRLPYAVHMDRVEHAIVRRAAVGLPWVKRCRKQLTSSMMASWHRRLISRSSLALCHGADCYAAYQRFTPNAKLVHDVLDPPEASTPQMTDEQLHAKQCRTRNRQTVSICYAGRVDPEKGPLDWVRALATARDNGSRFEASWLGDGSQLAEAKRESARLGLEGMVSFPGFVSDRCALLERVADADLMLFTHLTPESPRCLVEAIRVATPIVGYESAYAHDLISQSGGGRLSPTGDWQKLGLTLSALLNDRPSLADLQAKAFVDGRAFTSAAVFKNRSYLIKEYLREYNPAKIA